MEKLNVNKIYPTEDRLLMETYSHAGTTSEGLEQVNENTNTAPVIGKVIRAGEKSKYKEGQGLMWRRYSLDILKIPTSEGDVEYNLLEDSRFLKVPSRS